MGTKNEETKGVARRAPRQGVRAMTAYLEHQLSLEARYVELMLTAHPMRNRRVPSHYRPHKFASPNDKAPSHFGDVSPWGPWAASKWKGGKVVDGLRGMLLKPWRRVDSDRHGTRVVARVALPPWRASPRWETRVTTKLALRRIEVDWQHWRWEMIGVEKGILTPEFPYRQFGGER